MKVASFEKLKSDWNQTWFIDAILDPLYVHVVKGHILRSKVIIGQVVRWTENVKFTSFEKLKSNCNQTWFIDIRWEPTPVHEVKGHMKVKVHVRSTCKIV